jgi:phosphatidate cytidylyltransferase
MNILVASFLFLLVDSSFARRVLNANANPTSHTVAPGNQLCCAAFAIRGGSEVEEAATFIENDGSDKTYLSQPEPPSSDAPTTTSIDVLDDEPAAVPDRPSASKEAPTEWRVKVSNFRQRAGPAVVLLVALYALVSFGEEQGLQWLALLLSPGLYYEATAVVQDPTMPRQWTLAALVEEWYWFVAYSLVWTIPTLLSQTSTAAKTQLGGYLLIVLGLVGTVVRLNQNFQAVPRDFYNSWSRMATCHLATVFTILPCACWMAALQTWPRAWVLYAASLVILNDTMAYVFGMTLGKHALLPTISPKKTWEGWAGAWVSTMLLSPLVWKVLFKASDGSMQTSYGQPAIVIGLFVNTLAPFGGFVASTLKRAYGHKDFGTLIQGHGGLLDRLDCQLFTAPFVYLYLQASVIPQASTLAP